MAHREKSLVQVFGGVLEVKNHLKLDTLSNPRKYIAISMLYAYLIQV